MKDTSKAIATMAVLALLAVPTSATTFTFDVTDGLWDVAGNWTPAGGPPTAGDTAIIPVNKLCRIESVEEDVAVLEVYGTLKIVDESALVMDEDGNGASTIDGELIFIVEAASPNPLITVRSDLVFTGSGTIRGTTVFQDTPEINAGGWFLQSTIEPSHTVTLGSGITATGSLFFTTSVENNGTVHLDDEDDIIFVGHTAFPTPVLSGSGSFVVEAGTLVFDIFFNTTATWDVTASGGIVFIPSFCSSCYEEVPGDFTFTGGTFDVNERLCSTGSFSFNNCTVDVAANKDLIFAASCP